MQLKLIDAARSCSLALVLVIISSCAEKPVEPIGQSGMPLSERPAATLEKGANSALLGAATSDWVAEWSNNGNGYIAGWHISPSDRYASVRLSAVEAFLFSVAPPWEMVTYTSGTSVANLQSNYGNGFIPTPSGGGWALSSDDKYAAYANRELLAVNNRTRWASDLLLNVGNPYYWSSYWSNNASGKIGGWQIGNSDVYLGGDFYSSVAGNELLCLSSGGWASLQYRSGGSWTGKWSNNGNGSLNGWQIRSSDAYVVDDFDGDGIDELLCINAGGRWAALLKFNGSGWDWRWANNGNGWIGSWQLRTTDTYRGGEVDGQPSARLFAVNPSGKWAMLQAFSAGTWTALWSNGGNGKIAGWNLRTSDRYLVDWFGQRCRLWIVNIQNGWSVIMRYGT